MKNRLFQKIFMTTAIAMLISTILILVLLSISVNNYFVNDKKQLLTDNCKTVSSVLSSQTDNSEKFYVSLNGMIRVVSNAVLGETYVCDSEGNVFICSCTEWNTSKSCAHSKSTIPQNILNIASKGSFFEVGRLSGRFENSFYTAATPFYSFDGKVLGFVFISSRASHLQAMWSELSQIYIICTAIPLTVLFVFLYFMTRKITRPINHMSKAAENMSKGDFSQRIPVEGDDEIATLAATFNAMTDSLTQLEGMRRSFIANVSHELRTPMTTIGGFIDGILDGTIPPDKQEAYLTIVSSEVKRLSRLVQSMLSLARLESGEMKPNPTNFILSELICDVLLSQEQRIDSKNLNIEGLDDDSDVELIADRDLIYQVVYNLLDNAIKFTPENGTIDISVLQDENKNICFSIKNDGKGISPEHLKYIFDRFYKSDKARSANKDGTGLGLYIVKTIVDIHKGSIKVKSQPDEFTEFTVTLPKRFS
ncbi:MAG: HAMP domain-containing histidine kinase [Clostridia bacterium]|nr:HAMP domain-containing histidine kinase [Clostridia bacterium]